MIDIKFAQEIFLKQLALFLLTDGNLEVKLYFKKINHQDREQIFRNLFSNPLHFNTAALRAYFKFLSTSLVELIHYIVEEVLVNECIQINKSSFMYGHKTNFKERTCKHVISCDGTYTTTSGVIFISTCISEDELIHVESFEKWKKNIQNIIKRQVSKRRIS